jgi:hypothetical protein
LANFRGSIGSTRNAKMDLGILLGTTTLICWMGAGVAAVIETDHEMSSGEMKGVPEQVSFGLTVAGVLLAVAMAVMMAWR